MRTRLHLLLSALLGASALAAQPWSGILPAGQGIDWSQTGVPQIPARASICARLAPPAGDTEINRALAACPAGAAVLLQPGVYTIRGSIHVPSHVTLRGIGADQTILDAHGAGEAIIALGSGSVPFAPRVIASGSTAGSEQIQLKAAQGIAPGMYLVIAERNDSPHVTSEGSGGNCNWCDGWTRDGSLARGQIVEVTAVRGTSLSFTPALYTAYTHDAIAVPFSAAAVEAGVEDLQIRANNTGYEANFRMALCVRCWIKGVESNYADGDHVSVQWGYRDEIRDSYFSNAYVHLPGAHEADIQLAMKSSGIRVENNIVDRTHVAVMLEWGTAGNVIAYNYTTGEFDSDAPDVVVGGIDFHGAHPQFNLIEGNVLPTIYADSVWGSSSRTTAFRNWMIGTSRVCQPLHGRVPADCAGPHGHQAFQAARAVQLSYLSSANAFVANVLGSAQAQALKAYGRRAPQFPTLEYPQPRRYEAVVGFSFGYGSASDDGTGDGCGGGKPPCHAAGTSASDFLNGNFSNWTHSIGWAAGAARAFPASLYLSGRPAWWGSLPYPAIGPDVRGGSGPGGHAYGNPAQRCYLRTMGGVDGGAGSPLRFNSGLCYPGSN